MRFIAYLIFRYSCDIKYAIVSWKATHSRTTKPREETNAFVFYVFVKNIRCIYCAVKNVNASRLDSAESRHDADFRPSASRYWYLGIVVVEQQARRLLYRQILRYRDLN